MVDGETVKSNPARRAGLNMVENGALGVVCGNPRRRRGLNRVVVCEAYPTGLLFFAIPLAFGEKAATRH